MIGASTAHGRVELSTMSLEKGFLKKLIKEQGVNSSRHFVGLLRVHVEQYVLFIIRSRVSTGGFWEVPYFGFCIVFMCGVGKVKTS